MRRQSVVLCSASPFACMLCETAVFRMMHRLAVWRAHSDGAPLSQPPSLPPPLPPPSATAPSSRRRFADGGAEPYGGGHNLVLGELSP